jgi:WS/DGAT/MGAT family acyltransferase
MFKQLSGMDSLFLYAESHRAPLEVGCLQIYDPSTAPGGKVRFKEILATYQHRLDRCEFLRQKLVEVPLSLDHPYWTEDEDFDLEYHVRHISLPKPGDWGQLMAQVSRLQARQLDHSKPLWMAHVIEGLDNVPGIPAGSFAMFTKMHHSAIDGVTGQDLQAIMHDHEPFQADAAAYVPSTGPHHVDSPPSWNLLARTPLNTIVNSTKLGIGLLRSLPAIARLGLILAERNRDDAPMTQFNEGSVSPNRVINGCFFDLSEFRQVRAAVPGSKVNDVALAVVGGALRRYLEARDDLPEESLIAACPIYLGTKQDVLEGRANLLGMMVPSLHTEIADPVERLRAVHDSTKDAKDWIERFGATSMTQVLMNLPAPIAKGFYPLVMALAKYSKRLLLNTIVTNVVVQHAPLYFNGAKLIRSLATGPVIDQLGLFHTVFSFDGEISIGFTACRARLPDPDFYAECIEKSYTELRAAVLDKQKPARKKPAKRKSVANKPAPKQAAAKPANTPPPDNAAQVDVTP